MREFIGLNSNVTLNQNADDGEWRSSAEVIIITSEPQYHLDEDYEIKRRRRECEQFRFIASENAITALIEALEKVRFEIQSAETAVNAANLGRKAA